MQRQFQLLHSLITIEADQEKFQNEIDFVSQDARQTIPVRTESLISVKADRIGSLDIDVGASAINCP